LVGGNNSHNRQWVDYEIGYAENKERKFSPPDLMVVILKELNDHRFFLGYLSPH
jgi:hypothetical protein